MPWTAHLESTRRSPHRALQGSLLTDASLLLMLCACLVALAPLGAALATHVSGAANGRVRPVEEARVTLGSHSQAGLLTSVRRIVANNSRLTFLRRYVDMGALVFSRKAKPETVPSGSVVSFLKSDGLVDADVDRLMQQSARLATGEYDFLEGGIEGAALRAFWTRRSPLVGVLRGDGDRLRFFIAGGQAELAKRALPSAFRGHRIELVETTVPLSRLREARSVSTKDASRYYDLRVALVTGAGAGLGEATAKRLIADPSFRVVLTAREKSLPQIRDWLRAAGLEESDRILVRALDVTDEEQMRQLMRELSEQWGGLDVLVNNAGVSRLATVLDESTDGARPIFETNYFGPVALAREVAPAMRFRERGRIINVSSAVNEIGSPGVSTYAATKAALDAASEAMWQELSPYGVDVSTVIPGFVRSDALDKLMAQEAIRAKIQDPTLPDADVYRAIESITYWGNRVSVVDADRVATKVARVATQTKRPRHRLRVTGDARWYHLLRRVVPESVYLRFIRRNIRNWDPSGEILVDWDELSPFKR